MPSTSSVPSWSIRSGSLVPDRIVATWPAASLSFTRFGRMFTSSPSGVEERGILRSRPPDAEGGFPGLLGGDVLRPRAHERPGPGLARLALERKALYHSPPPAETGSRMWH